MLQKTYLCDVIHERSKMTYFIHRSTPLCDSVLEKAAGIESGSLIGFYQVISQSESCNQQTNYTLSSQIGADHHQDKSFKQKPVQDLKSLTCQERDPTTRKSLTCQEKITKLVSIDKLTSPSPVLGEATSAAVGR